MNRKALLYLFILLTLFAILFVPILQKTVFLEFENTYTSVVSNLLESEARMLANQVRNDLLSGNTRYVRMILEQSIAKSGFDSFRIISSNGKILEDTATNLMNPYSKFEVNIDFTEGGVRWGRLEFFPNPKIFDRIKNQFQTIQIVLLVLPILFFLGSGLALSYLLGYSSIQISRFVDASSAESMNRLEQLFWSNLISKIKIRSAELASLVSKTVLLEEKATFSEISRQFAHDIRSPISSMTLLTHSLDESNVSDRKLILKEACERIVLASKELLNKTRANNLRKVEVSLETLIASLIKEKQIEYSLEEQLSIQFEGDVSRKFILPDLWVRRVISNLINNAVEAIGSKPRELWNIKVVITNNQNVIRIAVSDNGSGLTEKVREKVLSQIFTSKLEGNGLGLYDAKKLAIFMNGKFDIFSNDSGGATAQLTLNV